MTQQEYIALVDEARKRSYEYYVLAQPTVSDAAFDALVGRIEQAEQEHPEWTLADSPTQVVGSDVDGATGRRLVRHRTRMLSCQKAQTTEAVGKWMQTTEKKLRGAQRYAMEWKIDGVSCSLVYQDGVLVSAASRGHKGVAGQDWLQHVGCMPSVPQRVAASGRVEVRGEIVCPKSALASLGYKDCRTAAASLMNQAWPSAELGRLVFVAWQMDAPTGTATEGEAIEGARALGFTVTEVRTAADVIGELQDYYETEREALAWPVDGVVIKVDDRTAAASLGFTEHHPKGSIAYKFSAQKTVARVLRVEISVGATGRRTPVAYLEPVVILGREVSSASLGSERVAAELGVCAGCLVEVGLSNDVTPKVYRVVEGAPVIGAQDITDSAETVTSEPSEASVEVEPVEVAAEPSEPCICSAGTDAEPSEAVEVAAVAAERVEEGQAVVSRMQQELDALRAENERLRAERMVSASVEHVGDSPRVSPTRRQRRERRREQDVMQLHTSPAVTVDHSDDDHSARNMKIFAAIATAAVFLVLVNTVGLFGVAALGLLAGGLVK